MRWLVDESVDAILATDLREAGHDVTYVAEVDPRAIDRDILTRAQRENRILLTEDKDFGELVFRQGLHVPGLILLRIDPIRRALKRRRLHDAVARFGNSLFGRYTVIEDARFRSRRLRVET